MEKTCKNCGTPITKEYCEDNYPEVCEHWTQKKPKTNADRIRAMSDEELAQYIDAVAEACYNAGAEDLPLSNSNPLSNAYNILEWLKQPAEEVHADG